MKNAFLGLVLAVCAMGPMQAEQILFPQMFQVQGVATGDVLNIRAEPSADAAILGSLPSDRTDLEVLRLSEDGAWARVGQGEFSGWVAVRFLAAQASRADDRLPVPLRCYGTEPFWGLNLPSEDFAEFERLPDPELAFEIGFQSPPIGFIGVELVAQLRAADAKANLILRREMCSDGMSDREFGLSALLILERGAQPEIYSGCCSLTGP